MGCGLVRVEGIMRERVQGGRRVGQGARLLDLGGGLLPRGAVEEMVASF